MAPSISTWMWVGSIGIGVDGVVVVVGLGRERRPHATAWLAPLPPAWVLKEVDLRVSPGCGKRGVTETMSTFREPMMRIAGGIFSVFFFFFFFFSLSSIFFFEGKV